MTERRYLLDTSAMLAHPELLTRGSVDVQLFLSVATLQDLRRISRQNAAVSDVIAAIEAAVSQGALHFARSSNAESFGEWIEELRLESDAGTSDIAVLNAAAREKAILVTEDRDLEARAKGAGIPTARSQTVLAETTVANEALTAKTDRAKAGLRRELALNFLLGALTTIAAQVAFRYREQLLTTVNVWATILLIPAVGIALFWFRQRYRLAYGITESLIGMMTALHVFLPAFNYEEIGSVQLLQILGGLYIIVRGLDNVDKAIEDTTLYRGWSKLFGSKRAAG